MKSKTFEDWTFDELVDHCAGEILKDLLAGKFRTSVFCALELACRWKQAQDKKKR